MKEDDTPLPTKPQPSVPAKPAKWTACMGAVMTVVYRADGPLTQAKILSAMEAAGMHPYSDRWIAEACQRLVECGALTRDAAGYASRQGDAD